jgi:hypothetical protein
LGGPLLDLRLLPFLCLKHAIFVGRILRHGLPNIPEFRDEVSLEPENMYHGDTQIAWLLYYLRSPPPARVVFPPVVVRITYKFLSGVSSAEGPLAYVDEKPPRKLEMLTQSALRLLRKAHRPEAGATSTARWKRALPERASTDVAAYSMRR